jgi:hypothetical protein
MSHWRHRRDNNESPLVTRLEQLGGLWLPQGPFDGWAWGRGRWFLCEVKDPAREGHKDEFTPAQLLLIQKLNQRQIPWHKLRTEDDIYALMGARRTA